MLSVRTLLASLTLAVAALSSAQAAEVVVSASAGAVAVRNATGGWTGLEGSAARATIDAAGAPPQFKFSTTPSGVVGKSFSDGGEVVGGGVSTAFMSTVTPGAFTDYHAAWTTDLGADPGYTGSLGTGTFDPFDVTYGDLGGQTGLVSLYFQSALLKDSTSLFGGSTQIASYTYSLYVTSPANVRTDVLSLTFSTVTGLSVDFAPVSDIGLTLLDPVNADDPGATPGDRIAAGTPLVSPTQSGLIAAYFNPDGSLKRDLSFGLLRTLTVLPGGDPDDVLFAWHADTTLNIGARSTPVVPTPAAAVAFGLGALARRRRRA